MIAPCNMFYSMTQNRLQHMLNNKLTLYVILLVWMLLNFGGSLNVFIPRSAYLSLPTRFLTSYNEYESNN